MDEKIKVATERKLLLEGGEISVVLDNIRGLEKEQHQIQKLETQIQQLQMKHDLIQSNINEMEKTIDIYEGSLIMQKNI